MNSDIKFNKKSDELKLISANTLNIPDDIKKFISSRN